MNSSRSCPDTGWMPLPDNNGHEIASPIDILRLTRAATRVLNESLDRQDTAATHAGGAAQRGQTLSQNLPPLVIEIHRPGSSTSKYLAYPRRIESEEISLLHGFFLNVGIECLVTLTTLDRESLQVAAAVRRCRHVHGRVHEVVLGFHRPIDPDHFVEQARVVPAPAVLVAAAPAPSAGEPGSSCSDSILEAAEELVSLAWRCGPPEERVQIESRLRALLGKAA